MKCIYITLNDLIKYKVMSENERKELSEKLHFGLALAERRMLEEKHCAMNALYKACPMERLKCTGTYHTA